MENIESLSGSGSGFSFPARPVSVPTSVADADVGGRGGGVLPTISSRARGSTVGSAGAAVCEARSVGRFAEAEAAAARVRASSQDAWRHAKTKSALVARRKRGPRSGGPAGIIDGEATITPP